MLQIIGLGIIGLFVLWLVKGIVCDVVDLWIESSEEDEFFRREREREEEETDYVQC